MLRQFFILSIFLLTTVSAHASYLVVPFNREKPDTSVRTHFIVTSRGGELGMGPQLSALTKAVKLVDVYPNDQVVLLLHDETDGNLKWIQKTVAKTAYRVEAKFTATDLFNELEPYTKIVSIHTFGHSAISEGVFLGAVGERDIRWYQGDKNPKRIIGHFTDDAFVNLNGCNLGHSMGPMLSHLWKVPVAAALTGTHFEVLTSPESFSLMTPDERKWSKVADGLFRDDSNKCIRGCVRMRPTNAVYTAGHYGTYTQGLGFYKFFCVGIAEDSCLKGMARSLIAAVTPKSVPVHATREQFATAVREWMCPISESNPARQAACEAQLASLNVGVLSGVLSTNPSMDGGLYPERFYTPFPGRSHQCDFISCYAKRECLKNASSAWACAQTEAPPKRTTTFVDEYLNYLRGFDLL